MGNAITETQSINPTDLLVDTNVRSDLDLNSAFVGSIKEYGVLVPIVAVRSDDGLRVRMGHRRTVAAIEAGLPAVPVFIIETNGEGDTAEIERLLTQHAENHHRTALTGGDEVEVHRQLAAFGLSPTQIARKTKTPKKRVDDVLAVAGSPAAEKALTDHQLTLEQASVLAEFEDDEEAVNALVAAVAEGDFDHAAQRLRDDREMTSMLTTETDRLNGLGLTVVVRPDYDSPAISVDRLKDADGNRIDAETHTSCPGHAVYVLIRRNRDHDTDQQWSAETIAVCIDIMGNGHTDSWASSSNSAGKKLAADMSESERDEAKGERKRVIENNKAWDSSTDVRRAWIKTYLTRKTPSKAGTLLIAQALIERDEAIDKRWNGTVYELLDLERPAYGTPALGPNLSPARQQVIALAALCGGYEDSIGRHSWRNVSAGTARYLTS